MRLVLSFLLLFFFQTSNADLKDKAGPNPSPGAAKPFDFDYVFGRPLKSGEMTYNDYRRKHAEEAEKLMHLPADQVGDGMDTWHWWVGVDNPGFWTDLVKLTGGKHNYADFHMDFFRLLATLPRSERFKKLGLINDPDSVAADKPDQFGLKLDRMKDGSLQWDPEKFGYSSGVIGLQLFKNEKFDAAKWSLEKYLAEPGSVEPPYKVGMACAFCHVGFNPLNPPKDPAEPKWENLSSVIGDQYLHEGMAFGLNLNEHSLIYQYLNIQEPGTSETSRFPMDYINNPTNINTILRLTDRLKVAHVEKITTAQAAMIRSMYKNAGLKEDNITGALGGTPEAPTIKVPHVLTDGADSMGVLMASVRVYVNEGMMHSDWYPSWPLNPFHLTDSVKRGFKPQEFDIEDKWRKDPNSPWMQTERRMPNMATFLMSYDSYPLKEAKETTGGKSGKSYQTSNEETLNEGKRVFAENCASCHSSKRPESLPVDLEGQKKAWRDLVFRKDFLEHNYLSDDERHSVLEVGTNAQRAEGSNAMKGSTWGQMSSQTYKDQRAPMIELVDHNPDGTTKPLYNPLTGQNDIHWKGHQAFYRTPTLVSIWATAPYFHNNSLGEFTGDPSVAGRMRAFNDAIMKMLWPEKRLGPKSVKVTTEETSLPELLQALKLKRFNAMEMKFMTLPKGTPLNLIFNLNPKSVPQLVEAYIKGVLQGEPRTRYNSLIDRRREAGMEAMKKKMLELNTCPDFIEDRGHYYGAQLADKEKLALIEYMKYF
jgi:mono/diheme cytochrome c family protein